MRPPIGILPMRNRIQPYPWGSRTFLAELLGRPAPAAAPQAELWMGVHPQGPSEVWTGERWEPLPELIRRDPPRILGPRAAERFGGSLPFLFKVLAAERPLSIQAHPDTRQARRGFARENAAGIPLDAPHRSYRDPNPKPELLCALRPVYALYGFRPLPELLELLDALPLASLHPLTDRLRRRPDPGGLRAFFRALLALDPPARERVVAEAAGWARAGRPSNGGPAEEARAWVARLAGEYPRDVGALGPLLLNLLRLEPGQAIYLQPGRLHAYLEGAGVELMANSDNVLRGGLTSKPTDPPELLRILRFEGVTPARVAPRELPGGEVLYPTPAEQFLLSRLTVASERPYTGPADHGPEILLAVEGRAVVSAAAGEPVPLLRGGSLFVPAGAGPYRIDGRARIYRASVPPG